MRSPRASTYARRVEAIEHNRFPVTSIPRTLLDLAKVLAPRQLRPAPAEADYRGLLDPAEVAGALKHGRPGSKALRLALRSHMPALAATLSELEERELALRSLGFSVVRYTWEQVTQQV